LRDGKFWNNLFLKYKLSRFVFSTALFIVILSLGVLREGLGFTDYSLAFLSIYPVVSFFTLSYRRVNYLDFILDIVFISALILSNRASWQYFSILYLFPLFFSAALTGSRKSYMLSVLSFLLYSGILLSVRSDPFSTSVKMLLNLVAFLLIVNAGLRFNRRIEQQDEYIRKLEREREMNRVYRHLFNISANLAHEIRNPLSSIKAASDLLMEGKRSEKLLRMISEEAGRLNRMLKEFLSLSRPLDSKVETFNLKDEMERVAALYGDGKSVELNGSSAKVSLRRDAFISAISNIFKNCVEWARSRVSLSWNVSDKVVKVQVEDDGPGIDESDVEKIFEPFFTKREGGTGLGLSIAKRIVMELGGKLTVGKSRLGGAKFTIEIPQEVLSESPDR